MGASLSVHQEAGLLGKARVRAGDRAPDVVFLDSRTGAQTSLFAPLGRSRFVALLGPGYNPAGAGARPAPKTGRLVEDLGRLGVECSVVLPGSARSGDGLIDATGTSAGSTARAASFSISSGQTATWGCSSGRSTGALQDYMAKLFEADTVAAAFAGRAVKIPARAG
ncbi:MAG: hypothetical protein M3P37_14755 [Actinomycetota bacterium]|nr:hypothetical protein [Actinomycetota bacterium]